MFLPKPLDIFSPEGGCSEGLDVFRLFLNYNVFGLEKGTDHGKRHGSGKFSVFSGCCCFLTLTDPLRIQPWSQDRRNQTKSNRESEMSMESIQKRTGKK